MAKVNLLALGGLDEKQRRLYILEIDSKIFILDSGIYEPLNKDFGIRQIVPNLDYLQNNKDKIKGIFLSSANKMNIGSIIQIVNLKKDIEIYGAKTTLDALDVFYKDESKDWNKVVMKKNETKVVGGIDVRAIALASIIPGTFGYQFGTEDGNILYFTDYIFDSIREYGVNPIVDLSQLANEKNLLLISDVSNSTEKVAISSKFRIRDLVSKYLAKENRFVISIYEDEIINAIELIQLAKETKRKIFFKSQTMFKLLNIMIANGEIEEFPIRAFSDYRKEDAKKSIIVLSGTRTKLYKAIELIIEAHNENEFAFDEDDIVYFAALPQAGNEHIFASVSNKISRIDPVVVKPSPEDKKLFGTTEFDIRNMINLLQPIHFMPASAYFKQFAAAKLIAEQNGVDAKKIIIGDNGEVFTINKGVYEGISTKIKVIEPMVVESIGDSSINGELIEERKALGKDGVVTISFMYDKEKNVMASDIDIQMKGLVISRGQDQVMDKIKQQLIEASDTYASQNASITRAVPQLRKSLSRVFRENFKKVPMIVFNIVEV